MSIMPSMESPLQEQVTMHALYRTSNSEASNLAGWFCLLRHSMKEACSRFFKYRIKTSVGNETRCSGRDVETVCLAPYLQHPVGIYMLCLLTLVNVIFVMIVEQIEQTPKYN